MGIVFDLRTPVEFVQLFRDCYALQQVQYRLIRNERHKEGSFERDVGALVVYAAVAVWWCFVLLLLISLFSVVEVCCSLFLCVCHMFLAMVSGRH